MLFDVLYRNPLRLLACGLLALGLGMLPDAASAVTVSGVAFDDPAVINPTAETDLSLTTAGDVYIFVPNGLRVDTATLDAIVAVIMDSGTTIDFNLPPLCDTGCLLETYEVADDVILNILDPIGNLLVQSAGTIILSPTVIPEPATALLLGCGMLGLGLRGRETHASSVVSLARTRRLQSGEERGAADSEFRAIG